MNLGLSTYSFPWAFGLEGFFPERPLTINELLRFAFENNIKHVQIGDNFALNRFKKDSLLNLKLQADVLGIALQTGTRGLKKDNLLAYLKISETLGSAFLRVVIDDSEYYPDEKEVVKIINKVLPAFKASGILLAIENHDRFPAVTLARIIQQTNPDLVGICLDTANSLGAAEGITETVNILAPYTVNLHIKDFAIKRVSHKMGFTIEGTAAGDGMLNIPWLITELSKIGKCSTAVLEIWSGPKDSPELTIIQEKTIVNKSIKYLKSILE